MPDEDEWSYDAGDFDDGGTPDNEPVELEDTRNRDDTEDEDAWRFSLEDIEGDDEDEAGWLDLSADVEAGSPELENVVFVLLGVALGVAVAVQMFL